MKCSVCKKPTTHQQLLDGTTYCEQHENHDIMQFRDRLLAHRNWPEQGSVHLTIVESSLSFRSILKWQTHKDPEAPATHFVALLVLAEDESVIAHAAIPVSDVCTDEGLVDRMIEALIKYRQTKLEFQHGLRQSYHPTWEGAHHG